MKVMVAMSGGVDSSVAAALLVGAGHQVTGATLKLWGGPQDAGCCSVADVDDARRVAQQLGIDHHVFNLSEDFGRDVVEPYVEAHRRARTPNPCIECNRHIKFDRLLERAVRLGFDALATGHHARVTVEAPCGAPARRRLRRGADPAKDQSYVLSMLGQAQLARLMFPVGELHKDEVRARAAALGLRTAAKPDSQDVCFIHGADGRRRFLADRLALTPGTVHDADGRLLGEVDALELVTVGQRRGLVAESGSERRYVAAVDLARRRVHLADGEAVRVAEVALAPGSVTWVDAALADGGRAVAQVSAHGRPAPCTVAAGPGAAGGGDDDRSGGGGLVVRFDHRQRPIAPGQTVALYDADEPDAVVGAGIAA